MPGRGKREKSLSEGIREAQRDPSDERLEERGPEEPGKPGAVNVERDEPITNAARREDEF